MRSFLPRTWPARAIGAAALIASGFASPASAQTFVTTGRGTLRGLPGVEVAVEDLAQDVERDGVTRAAIQADVVNRLQTGGVTVYPSQAANPSPAKAYLYVHVNSLKVLTAGLYVMSVQVQARETVRSLASTTDIVDAMTWDHSDVVVVPISQLSSVRSVIGEFVDDFIRDWKAVH